MDNHPIPQDVTNFQFRLIGDMTIKQFGYVAGGVIVAWIFLALPVFILLKFLLVLGSVISGVALAFVPIDGRPSDVMVLNFIKALFNPTQFIYQKQTSTQGLSSTATQTPPPSPKKEEQKEPEKQTVELQTNPTIALAAVQENTPPTAASVPTPTPKSPEETTQNAQEEQKETALANQVVELTKELQEAKQEEVRADSATQNAAHEKVTDLEQTLQEMMQQKENLEKKLVELQKALEQKNQKVYTPSTAEPVQETQRVKKLPKQMGVVAGAPLIPDTPNLITGVIKDSRGNVLPNILIEVKDKDENPVRAFKTNQLGQFASATPLLNGLYTISFEDPQGKQSFDSVEINAEGDILSPLEIISIDERERLRKELFGS